VLAGTGLAALAQAGGFAIDAAVIAGGGGRSASPGGCLAVLGTIGQDTVGTAAGAGYTVRSGFWAGAAGRSDALFNHGFQECL
jgi:hypothetical protein